jgi:hypothetical protein
MEADNKKNIMTAQAAPRMPKDHHGKKTSGKHKKKSGERKTSLYSVSEHSLSGFLEDEPDLYSVADLKVRYR